MESVLPSFSLKIVWFLHLMFSGWAMLSGFIAVTTYIYTHLAFLGIGLWNLIDPASADAILMYVCVTIISMLNDIIILGIYAPRGYSDFEDGTTVGQSYRNEFRFAFIMCIVNLLLKPCTLFLLYRELRENPDLGDDFWATTNKGYEDLDRQRAPKEPDTHSEHMYVDLVDSLPDEPPQVPERNGSQSSQSTGASNYYLAAS